MIPALKSGLTNQYVVELKVDTNLRAKWAEKKKKKNLWLQNTSICV